MEIKYNCAGAERKAFVKAISDIVCEKAKYLGAPSFAFAITDWYTVTREGNLEVSDRADSEEVEHLIEELYARGYEAEPAEETKPEDEYVEETEPEDEYDEETEPEDESSEPETETPYRERTGYSIGLELGKVTTKPFTEETMNHLKSIIANRCELFRKAVGTTSMLGVSVQDDMLWFDWFDGCIDDEHTEMYKTFFTALLHMAENAKRVNAKPKDVENERFTMRTFLNRIGLSGTEHKALRRELLRNLSGNSAYRYGRPGEETITTICYGKTEKWNSRQEACDSFLEAMNGSEGAERERYTAVYTKLMAGMTVCSDDIE